MSMPVCLVPVKDRKFFAWYCGEELGKFSSVKEAQKCIAAHPKYKKSHFGKRGDATSKNPEPKTYFRIYDNCGIGWNIK